MLKLDPPSDLFGQYSKAKEKGRMFWLARQLLGAEEANESVEVVGLDLHLLFLSSSMFIVQVQ